MRAGATTAVRNAFCAVEIATTSCSAGGSATRTIVDSGVVSSGFAALRLRPRSRSTRARRRSGERSSTRRALKHGATTTLRSLRDLRDVPPAAQGAAEGRGFSRRSKSSRTSPSPKATATLTIVGTGASSGGVVPRSLDPATHCSGNGHPPPSAAANNRVDTSNFQNDGRSPTPNRHDLKRRRRAFGATDDLESSRGSKSPLNARSLDLPSHQRCDGCPVPEGAQRPMGRGRPSQESRA
jgi:hypothetical protein